jgi:flagellar protein FliO/FliZ
MKKLLFMMAVFGINTVHAEGLSLKGSDLGLDLGRLMIGLMVVIGLILLLAFVIRRLKLGLLSTQLGGLSVISTYPLGTKERVVLIKAFETYLLLGVTATSIQVLHNYGVELPQSSSASRKSTA